MKQKLIIALTLILTLSLGMFIGLLLPRPAFLESKTLQQPVRGMGMGTGMHHGWQNGGGPRGHQPLHLNQFMRQLQLTDTQAQQFRLLIQAHRDSMQAMMRNHQQAAQQKARQMLIRMNDEMQDILNKKQFRQWQQFYKTRMGEISKQ